MKLDVFHSSICAAIPDCCHRRFQVCPTLTMMLAICLLLVMIQVLCHHILLIQGVALALHVLVDDIQFQESVP